MLILIKEDMPYGFRTKRERVRIGGEFKYFVHMIFCLQDVVGSGFPGNRYADLTSCSPKIPNISFEAPVLLLLNIDRVKQEEN